jgi:putative copper resistance protein D
MPAKSPDPTSSVLLLHWQAHWSSLVAIAVQLVVLCWYLNAARRAGADARRWSPVRTGSFVLGLAAVAYAFEGGIVQYQRDNFTVHVVQILLLVDVAPPLLAIGAPVRLALQSSGRRAHARLLRGLHSRLALAATQPLVAFAVATASLYVYFLTPVYSWTERHPLSLYYVDFHFLLAGCLMWWAVVARDVLPRPPRIGLRFAVLFLSVPFDAYLGIAVGSLSKPLYPAGNTLADTQGGGNVLWGLAEVFIVTAVALLFVEWAREEERKAVRADRQLDAALAAARAAVATPSEPAVGGN